MKTLILSLVVVAALTVTTFCQSTVKLNYNVPTINPSLRRENDCVQIATYIIQANEGGSVGPDAFLTLFDVHKGTGTSVTGAVQLINREFRGRYHPIGTYTDLVNNLKKGIAPIVVTTITNTGQRTGPGSGHAMLITGRNGNKWQVADARGKRWVSNQEFASMWTGQWIETYKRDNS